LALGLAAAGIAASGGLAPIDPPPVDSDVRVTPSSAAVDVGAATLTLSRVLAIPDLEPYGPSIDKEKFHFLAIVVAVAVTDTQTWENARFAVRLEGVAGVQGTEPDQVILVRDGQSPDSIHPGLPEDVAYLWKQSNEVAVPSAVTVILLCQERLDAVQSDQHSWVLAKPCVRTSIAVQNRMATGTPTP
jgi:hypothetical protein